MRRLVTVLSLGVALFILAGCTTVQSEPTAAPTEAPTDTPTPTPTYTPTPTNTPLPTNTPTPTDTPTPTPSPTPLPICSELYLNALGDMLDRWRDARSLAISTPLLSLPGPISELQTIRREAEAIDVPCASEVHEHLIEHMNGTINALSAKMRGSVDDLTATFMLGFANEDFSLWEEGIETLERSIDVQATAAADAFCLSSPYFGDMSTLMGELVDSLGDRDFANIRLLWVDARKLVPPGCAEQLHDYSVRALEAFASRNVGEGNRLLELANQEAARITSEHSND